MTTFSNNSKASLVSQKILDQVSIKSSSPLFQLQALLNDNIIENSLSAFGAYINRQMRTGRSIQVPKLGVFSFSAPLVSLNGVTNPAERDQQPREPAFLISKQFLPGRAIKSGILTEFGVRSVDFSGVCGSNHFSKANFTEIASFSSLDKEIVRTSLYRVFQTLAEYYLKNGFATLEIPEVGMLIIRNGSAGVQFQEGLKSELRTVLSRSLKERKERLMSNLTIKNVRELSLNEGGEGLAIAEDAKNWLRNNLSLNVEDIFQAKPKEAVAKEDRPEEVLLNNENTLTNNEVLFESVSQRNYMMRKSIEKHKISQKPKGPLEGAVKKIKSWLRMKNLTPNDGFFELAKAGIGKNSNIGSKFSRDTFSLALEKQGIVINGVELESLFEKLDSNKDQLFDLKDWCEGIVEDEEVIQYIRDTIKKNHLLSDDLLKRMGLSRDQGAVTDLDVRNGFKLLMPDLSDMSLSKAIRYLQRKGPLTIVKLLNFFEFEDEVETFDEDWLNLIFRRLAQKDCTNSLQAEFEKFDKSNQGRLDIANFKTCLFKTKLGLGFEDINRISRYLEKDKDMMIDYVAFVQRIKQSSPHSLNQLSDSELITQLATHIKLFLQKHRIILKEFIKTLFDFCKGGSKLPEDPTTKPKIRTFALLFYPYVSVFYQGFEQFLSLAQKIDIDNDGNIDYFDLEVFLKRVNYIDTKRPSTDQKSRFSRNSRRGGLNPLRLSLNNENYKHETRLFPNVPLTEAKFDEVITDLRRAITDRKLSFFEVFQSLDKNEDGFLTINEFVEGIDKYLKLSQTIKEGLFAYLDTLRIGMLDYPQFLAGLKKPPNTLKKILLDNWDWQESVLSQIRRWFSDKKISFEEAFKIADQDFDGVINREDLRNFLLTAIKLDAESITTANLDRLYKLMDFSKKGFIYKSDFKDVFKEQVDSAWLQNVKHQLGLYLSQNFEDLKASFEKISRHSGRVTFKDFKGFIEETQCLSGFCLTETLLQQFFAFLDPHRKGFLTENDWGNAFRGLDFERQKLNEIIKAIGFHFRTGAHLMRYFKKNPSENSITFAEFFAGVNGVLPSRFHEADLRSVFKSMLPDKSRDRLDLETLQKVLGCSVQENPNILAVSSLPMPKTHSYAPINSLDSLRMKLKTANKDFEAEILKHDSSNTGLISSLELRNLIKDLKLGLSPNELVEVISLFQSKEKPGFFDYRRFLRVLQKTPIEQTITIRTKGRLCHLKSLIDDYLISAKNAFRQFNEGNSGKMSFEEFEKLAKSLYARNAEPAQPFDILKDIFDYIDLRKDGVIDIHEWMQTFRSLEKETLAKNWQSERKAGKYFDRNLSERRDKSLNMIETKPANMIPETDKSPSVFPLKINKTPKKFEEKSPLQYQDTKEYDDLIELIVRNRKLLQDLLEKEGNEGKITNQKALEIIKNTLNINHLPDKILKDLLRFSQKEDQLVHIRYFIDVLKDRAQAWTSPPKNFKKPDLASAAKSTQSPKGLRTASDNLNEIMK